MRAWPLVLTLLLAAGALVPDAVLRDALTRADVSSDGVTLSRPGAYVAFAPFCEVLDALTLLSVPQHVVLLATIAALLVLWRLVRGWRRGVWSPSRDAGAIAVGLVALLATYAAIIVPRPIAGLQVRDPELVAVDFHSHTDASWDVRTSFAAEDNRAWHRAGGWHVAYVTDHGRLHGAARGMAANPVRAGDDTVLLPGVELRASGLMVLVLGATSDDLVRLETRVRRVEWQPQGDPMRAVIATIPANLAQLRNHTRTRAGPIVAVEVSDGGLKGLEQMRRQYAELAAIARHANLAPVAGSNTHGWSQTPPAWSLLRIPGWRALAPDALGARIEAALREQRFAAVSVVERYAADVDATPFGLLVTLPAVAWHVVAILTPAERLACLAWIWTLAASTAALRGWIARRRARARSCVRPTTG